MGNEKVVGFSLSLLCVIAVLCTPGVVAIESQAAANQPETRVESASLSDSSVETGESVEITAEIRNTRDNARLFQARLLIDERIRDTEIVRVGPDTTETVTFRESFEQAGSYDIAVNDQPAGVLEVNEPAPAEFEITETALSDQSITIGETATVEATVQNIGDETGVFTIFLVADGTMVDSVLRGLSPRDSTTVEFEFEPDETGTYTLAVRGEGATESVGQLEVTEPAAFEVGPPSVSQEPVLVDEQTDIAAEIENIGGTEGTKTASLNIDGDTVETTEITLAAGETEAVSFDYSFERSGTYEVRIADGPATSITVQEPADISIRRTAISPETVRTGEPITATATVRNTGDISGETAVDLKIDGSVVSTEDVVVDGGDTETVEFTYSFETGGTYDVQIEDEPATSVTVQEPADISIRRTAISPKTVRTGEPITATATVRNTGDLSGETAVDLKIDGSVASTQDVVVDGGDTETVEFTYSFETGGTYDVQIEDEPATSITVQEPADISIRRTAISPETVRTGEPITATATVRNTGDLSGETAVDLEVDGTVVSTENVVVDGGDTETVEFTYSFETGGTYDVQIENEPATSVTVQEPADISLSDTEISPETVTTEEPITVTATVSNAGDLSGETAVDLEVDGTVVSTEDVVVDGGDTETVEFTHRIEEPGERTISVNGESTDTIQVLEPAELSVTSTSISNETVEMGEPVTANATVTNVGGVSGIFIAELEIDGEPVDSTELELDSDESAEISFREQFDSPGEYSLQIGQTEAGTVTVLEPADITVTSAEVGADSTTTDEALSVSASLENSGDLPGEHSVTLEIGDQAVETTDADVPAGEQQTIQFQHEFDEAGNKTVSVNDEFAGEVSVLEPATFEVASATVDQETMLVGEQLTVTATVENSGDVPGSFSGNLEIDGSAIESDTVNITGGETAELSFDHEIDRPGTYDISVASASAGTVRVDRPARLEVVNTTLSEAVILENETVTIDADLKNTGDRDGTFDITLSVNGTTTAMQSVQLQASESETVSVEQQFESAGSYDISVADTSAGTVTVDQPAEIELLETSVTPEHVMEGDTVEVIVAVTNTGDRNGTKAVDITVEDSHTDTHNFTVPARSNRTIRVAEELSSPGEYTVTVNGTTAGTVLVDEEPTFEIREANVPADWALAGSETTLRAVVENPGNWTTTQPVVITVDQEVIAREEVTLDSGERRELAIEFEARDGTVAINGVDAGNLRVDNGSTGTVQTADSANSSWDLSVLWLLSAVVAMLSFTWSLFVWRDWFGRDV